MAKRKQRCCFVLQNGYRCMAEGNNNVIFGTAPRIVLCDKHLEETWGSAGCWQERGKLMGKHNSVDGVCPICGEE